MKVEESTDTHNSNSNNNNNNTNNNNNNNTILILYIFVFNFRFAINFLYINDDSFFIVTLQFSPAAILDVIFFCVCSNSSIYI